MEKTTKIRVMKETKTETTVALCYYSLQKSGQQVDDARLVVVGVLSAVAWGNLSTE